MNRWRGSARPAALILAAWCLLVAGGWWAEGGRWLRVDTASMGRVAPVGTLLWIKPVPFDQLHVGDFITFHPPGQPHRTYSHRVYKIDADHTIETKGVIPAPDPWHLSAKDVVGEVRMRWWGVGWLVLAAPMVVVGELVVTLVVCRVRGQWRLPAALVLSSAVLAAAITAYRPFCNADQIAFAPATDGGANASYVGTGLLPIRLEAHGGSSVVLRDGQVGSVHVPNPDADRRLRVTLRPAVPWTFWAALVLVCMTPAGYSLARQWRPRRTA